MLNIQLLYIFIIYLFLIYLVFNLHICVLLHAFQKVNESLPLKDFYEYHFSKILRQSCIYKKRWKEEIGRNKIWYSNLI